MWPDDRELPVEVAAAFGANLLADPGTWSWTDLSSRLTADPIRSRAGRSSGAGQVSPGTLAVTLLNDDGALTPRNAMSPYWPNVALGTPLRVSFRRVEAAFSRTSSAGWGTADSGQTWSGYGAGGSILATDFTVGGGKASHSVPTASAYRASWLPGLSVLDCRVRLSGVSLPFSDVTGGSVEPGNILLRAQSQTSYYMARMEITTAEQVVCRLYNPAGTQLASATVAGLTHSSGQTLEVVAEILGTSLRMKVWATGTAEPAGWAVTATDSTLALPGGVGVRTGVAAGNTNTKPVVASYDSITVSVDRFSGFADQWEPTFTPIRPGESASTVQITASGLLRRLDQGIKPARSSPARFIPTTNPVAYWPLEDGKLVSEGAALVGGEPLRPFVGTHPSGAVVTFVQWGRGDLAPWLPDTMSWTGNHGLAIIWAPVRMSTTSQWCVDYMYRSGTDASSSTVDINPSYLPGGALGWPQLTLLPDVQGVDVSMNGEPEVGGTASTLFDGKPHHVRWFVWQDGAKVSWGVYVDGVGVNGGTTTGNMTVPAVSTIGLAAAAQAGADIAQGHLAVWASNPNHTDCVSAAFGHLGETAATRIGRLCAEEGIPISVLPGESEPLGPQPTAGVMDLLREAEAADMGVLYELGYGLGYRPRGARYNTPTTLTVDLATYAVSGRSGNVLEPTYDDQSLRNEWTVSRVEGASATFADAAHQQRSGVYDDSAELNVASDGVLLDHASWRVHVDSVDELREATFPLDLAANPALVDGWLSCGVGSRILRTNPPAQYGADPLDRLVEGWTEAISPRGWMVQVNPSPAEAWDVGVVDGPRRVAADGSILAADLTAGGTSLLLASTLENGKWTENPDDFPLPIRIGAEQATAGATGPALTGSYPQTVTTAVPRQETVLPLTAADVDITITNVTISAAATGASIEQVITARQVDASNFVDLRVFRNTAGAPSAAVRQMRAGVETVSAFPLVTGATATTTVSMRLQAVGSTLRGKTWISGQPEPPGWLLEMTATHTAAGGLSLVTLLEAGNTNPSVTANYNSLVVASPQLVTLSARGVNGVSRAWPAGTEVDVWQPAIVGL